MIRSPRIEYCPSTEAWESKPSTTLGMDAAQLAAAIEYHRAHETRWRRDFVTDTGLLWWLNTGCAQFPGAPASSYAARGAGSNVIFIDPEHDLVVVARWIDKEAVIAFLRLILSSIEN